jgi:polyisoprenoid-binding protein YceI
MKKVLFTLFAITALAVLPTLSSAEPLEMSIDTYHTGIVFKIAHSTTQVPGTFSGVTGDIIFDPAAPENSSIKAEIAVRSIDTNVDDRDNDLRSPKWLDAKKFPKMTYVSKKVVRKDADTYTVIGDLTLMGISKEIPLTVKYNGPDIGMMGKTRHGFSATAELDRSDFGIKREVKAKDGGRVVGMTVLIQIEVEAIQK